MARTLDTAKREAILKAATAILIRDGYASAKMSDVAAEAGVAQGTLYLYYESKEALASAIGEEYFFRLIAQFGELVKKIEDPDDIVDLVEWALRVAEEDRIFLTMARERKNHNMAKSEARKCLVSNVGEVLTPLMSRKVIRPYDDAAVLADLVLAVIRRLLMSEAVFGDENTDALKAGSIALLQHALFDDVTLLAYRLVKRKSGEEQV